MVLKIKIVITTQRACPILEYHIGDEDQNVSTGTMASSYHHSRRSMLKTTPPRPVNDGLNGKNDLKTFFLP